MTYTIVEIVTPFRNPPATENVPQSSNWTDRSPAKRHLPKDIDGKINVKRSLLSVIGVDIWLVFGTTLPPIENLSKIFVTQMLTGLEVAVLSLNYWEIQAVQPFWRIV